MLFFGFFGKLVESTIESANDIRDDIIWARMTVILVTHVLDVIFNVFSKGGAAWTRIFKMAKTFFEVQFCVNLVPLCSDLTKKKL